MFYLDPHHTRPAVPLQPLRETAKPESDRNEPPPPSSSSNHRQRQSGSTTIDAPTLSAGSSTRQVVDPLTTPRKSGTRSKADTSNSTLSSESTLDPVSHYYATAYSPTDLGTFHCDRVRKMPVSSLDPSMLLAFLCRDEADWKDLRSRVLEVCISYYYCPGNPTRCQLILSRSWVVIALYFPSKTNRHLMGMTRIRMLGCSLSLSLALTYPQTIIPSNPRKLTWSSYPTQFLTFLTLICRHLHQHSNLWSISPSREVRTVSTTMKIG